MHRVLIAASLLALAGAGLAVAQDAAPRGAGMMSRMLTMADANHDGTITRAEFDAARTARFAERDANHDGSLSADERPQWGGGQQRGGMMNADANNDGAISRAEYDAQGGRLFSRLDANSDGSVTQAEIQSMQQTMQQH